MIKSILIKENKIINEDALDQVSKELSLKDIFNSSLEILKAAKIVTQSLLGDMITGVKLAATSAFLPEKFNEILKDAESARRDLNNEWKDVMSNLGVDKPIEEFLNIIGPGSGFANTYVNKLSTRYVRDNNGFLGTLKQNSKDFADINKGLFQNIFGKKSVGDGDVKPENLSSENSKNIEKFYEWISKLDKEKSNKFYQWASKNPDDIKDLMETLNKKDYREIIKIIEKNVLVEFKTILIKKGKLILENKSIEEIKKDFDEKIKDMYIKSVLNNLDSLAKSVSGLNKQEEIFKKDFEEKVEEVQQEIEKSGN